MDRFLRERDRLADNRICDIQYDEIRRGPIGAVRRIYDYFDWSLSPEAEQRMRVLLASQAERSANHRYRSIAVWLPRPRKCSELFATYCQRFGLASQAVCSRSKQRVRSPDPMRRNNSRMIFEAIRIIRANHPTLPGHFPGAPLVPGVVILDEVLAALIEWRQDSQLTGIRMVKFLAPLCSRNRHSRFLSP